MKSYRMISTMALSLSFAATAQAQVVGGVMLVTGAEMH